METLLHSSAIFLTPKAYNSINGNGFSRNQTSFLIFSNGHSSSQKPSVKHRKSVIVAAKKKNSKKEDTHSFVPKPDEDIGPFPEAVLLKEKKVEKDGKLVPEFVDEEEEKIYEVLKLQIESDTYVDQMRHYEVVYLIHEKHAEEVEKVNEKVRDFLREKRGRIWRISDWGMRRLAYKIQKAKNAHYILMNFEIEAKWINDFKTMLDQDERVIRHLVIKRDEAITEDCPPPPEFHTLRADMDDDDDVEDDDEDYDEEWDDEADYDDEDGIIMVNDDEDDEDRTSNLTSEAKTGKLRAEKVGR